MPELVRELDNRDPVVRARAADALEKLTAGKPGLLSPFKADILRLDRRSRQQEVRWHLAQMLPRLSLRPVETLAAFSLLEGYLEDRSVIVKVCAMQAMFELSLREPALRSRLRALVETSCRAGAPAMRARGRKLLARIGEEEHGQ
jgi:HEAT repeat protein